MTRSFRPRPLILADSGWRTEQLRRRHARLARRYLGITGRGWTWIAAVLFSGVVWAGMFVAITAVLT